MKKKKIIALGLSLIMGLSLLAGCGGKDGGSSNTGGSDTGSKTEKENDKGGDEVVTLKWIQVGNGMPKKYDEWLEQINPYLEEKIGVNLDMEIVPWSDWENRRSVITNSGEYFDILFTDQTRYNAEIASGALLDITDLLEENAPDVYKMIPEDYWKAVSVNDKIYSIPSYKDSSLTEYFVWDKDVADKYNIDINSVTDIDSLYTALKTIKDGEGTSPYYMSKNGANFLINMGFDDLSASLPVLGIKYTDDSKTVVNPLADEDVLTVLDKVHQMYNEGIINGDAPNADDANKYRTFFTAQGWSGAAITSWGPNNGIENCVAVQYGDTVVSNTTVRGSLNAIYSGCKYPEKALQLLNLVNTDTKVRDLLYYGVEDYDFKYNEDGKVERLTTDWGMAGYTQGSFFNVTQQAIETFNQWDEVKELNENAKPSIMLGFNMDTSAVENEIANCRAVYEKYRYEFFTGAQNPRELIETINSELEAAGWDKVRAEAQKQVDASK